LIMLEEPWMKDVAKKNVNMHQFLRKVWDWKEMVVDTRPLSLLTI